MTYPRFQRSRHFTSIEDDTSSLTWTGDTDWQIPNTGFNNLRLLAEPGDVIEAHVDVAFDDDAVDVYLDVFTLTDLSSWVRSFGSRAAVSSTDVGIAGWTAPGGAVATVSGSYLYELTDDDFDLDGVVVLGLFYRMPTATDRDVLTSGGRRVLFWVRNLGPAAEHPV